MTFEISDAAAKRRRGIVWRGLAYVFVNPISFVFHWWWLAVANKNKKIGWLSRIATILTSLWLFPAILGAIDYLPGNTYSEGWMMGQVSHIGEEGNPWIMTGEIKLMYGNLSSGGEIKKGTKVVFKNPGMISGTRGQIREYRPLSGEYVAIRYKQVKVWLSNVNGDSDFRVYEMVPVNKSLAENLKPCGTDTGESIRGEQDATGFIAQISHEGNLYKSDEMYLQAGSASGTFVDLTFDNDDLKQCALNYLKAGVMVKVHYTNATVRNPLTANTRLNVTGIARAGTLTNG